jgi:hypothetical protein
MLMSSVDEILRDELELRHAVREELVERLARTLDSPGEESRAEEYRAA